MKFSERASARTHTAHTYTHCQIGIFEKLLIDLLSDDGIMSERAKCLFVYLFVCSSALAHHIFMHSTWMIQAMPSKGNLKANEASLHLLLISGKLFTFNAWATSPFADEWQCWRWWWQRWRFVCGKLWTFEIMIIFTLRRIFHTKQKLHSAAHKSHNQVMAYFCLQLWIFMQST